MHGDDPYDLGHTVAGWTGTVIASAGCALCGLAVITASGLLVAAGMAAILLAALVTWALHLAGWGKASGPRPPGEWGLRVRDGAAAHGHRDCLGCRLAGRRRSARTTAEDADVMPAPGAPARG
ncbi:HGxxPAAW family protein [Streptomyces mangrovisoli]|uniref:Uncharacterized protein n=1 Tax=Streptomyces mangrovisoli TaxID=1428628 RepID=A0A1J4NM18_9ACTN|nr:HGxxPAAW family protein [Streptomyces mangrovisoli]OIJ62668.1 hypothetical protein WN71_038440 [Streptomyces mangrovisoli]